MIPLRAAARLQLQAEFDFDAAAAQVPYYAALGASHLYLSPIGCAVPGSLHGYDNVDPGTVNPELGGEAGLRRLSQVARAHGLGLLLDIVPNHMAAHAANRWWWDVLRHGRRSRYADWFDIDWRAPGCAGRLWLPVLDRPLAQALREGLLQVLDDNGELQLAYQQQRFPLDLTAAPPPSDHAARAHWCRALVEDARASGSKLLHLLERQPYRLAWWRSGSDMLNYRRFLDISSLAALRIELPAVFDAVHALPLRLVAEGHVDGLRIDHIDGLAEPEQYLRRLRSRLDTAGRARGLPAGSIALYVEKVLAPGQTLAADWRCDGSTGYDFMDQVGGLLHATSGQHLLTRGWRRGSGRSGDFALEERQARAEMLHGPLQAEFRRALDALAALARRDPHTRELSAQMLERALAALLCWLPGYRAGGAAPTDAERAQLQASAHAASAGMPEPVRVAIAAIVHWLRGDADVRAVAAWRLARRRVGQLATALAAKAVEDTAYYRHGVLLSRNEVGSRPEPAHFALQPERFHAACQIRLAQHPRALLTTATHDHKRGEDVRARLAVLSTHPRWWLQQLQNFDALGQDCGVTALSGGERWMLWQTLVATWPPMLQVDDEQGLHAFAARIVQWQHKALREAKLSSNWHEPAHQHEQAARACVERILTAQSGLPLRHALWQAAEAIGVGGARNGLVQVALRLTVPGVPDLYQGCEGWDLSLVDPDNRRAVDYPQRHAWLQDSRPWRSLLHDWRDGAVKARLIARLLQLRATAPLLFAAGNYQPLAVSRGAKMLAFQRQHRDERLVVAVAWADSHAATARTLSYPPGDADTALAIPAGHYLDVLTNLPVQAAGGRSAASSVFAHGPVAVWHTL